MQGSEVGGDFDDFEFGASVDVGVEVADVVEDVEHEGSVAGAHFVDDEVVVGVVGKLVVCDEVAGDGFAVVGAEELSGGVPELPGVVGLLSVESVFEGSIALAKERMEMGFIGHGVEVEGLAGGEDDDLFGEVPVVGVV